MRKEGERKLGRQRMEKKLCKSCGEIKLRSEFYEKTTNYITKNGEKKSIGIRTKCKECQASSSKKKWAEDVDYRTNQYKASRKNLLAKYGMTVEEYKNKCEEQDNICPICGTQVKKLVVDHCHITGLMRGLLCQKCNAGLGLLKDNEEYIYNALEYISGFNSRHRNNEET